MIKPITPAMYRKRVYKCVQLPGGEVFKIKKLTTAAFNAVSEIFPVEKGLSAEDIRKMIAEKSLPAPELSVMIEKVIPFVVCECVVQPKVIASAGTEEALSIDEIAATDQLFLFVEILKHSGLTKEGLEALRSFR